MRNYENVNTINESYLKPNQIILCNTTLGDDVVYRKFLLDHIEGLTIDEYLLLEGHGDYGAQLEWTERVCTIKELLEIADKNCDDVIFWNQVKIFLSDDK